MTENSPTPATTASYAVGDHVRDTDDDEHTRLVVVGLHLTRADEYTIEDYSGEGTPTVADLNPDYDDDDAVVEVIYPDRTTLDIGDAERYVYPASRLTHYHPEAADE